MAKITYDDKEIYVDGTTNSQYFRYQDANEIKNVVNTNDTNLERVDTRLERLYELLSQETTQTGTEITINNTFADNMKLDLKGNTEQYTTTGKNLLNVTANSTTINGITFTKNSDNSVTANGTSTSTAAFNLIGSNSFTLPAGQYFLSGCPKNGSDNTYRLDVNTGNVSGRIDYGNGSTFTLTESLTVTSVRIRVASGVTLNNINFYPMIAEGSSASTYEPYTGGIPSPSPSFPQQVKVVTGNNSVNIEGENLNYLQDLKWIVNSSGVVVTNNTYWDAIIDTRNHNSIYISGDFSLLSDSAIRVGLFTDYPALNSQGVRVAITSNSAIDTTNCNYVLLCYVPTGTHTIDEIRNSFMVSYGNTQVPYTPYVSTSYPVNLGKNLVNALETSSMINFTKNDDVFKTSALTSTGYGGIASTTFTNSTPIIKNGVGYFSADIRLVSGTASSINVIGDKALTRINIGWVSNHTLSNEFQRYCYKYDVSMGTSFTGFLIQLYNCNNAVIEVKNIMFSYSSDFDYSPYKTPIELCKIGDYQDYLYKDLTTNKWYKHKAIEKMVLNGTETNIAISGTNRYHITLTDTAKAGSASTPNAISSHYVSRYSTANYGIYCTNNGTLVSIMDNRFTSVDAYKTWLTTNNVTIYYVLNTATDVEITDTTLIEQLEAINNAQSYDYQTNITQTNAILPFIITATARVERS